VNTLISTNHIDPLSIPSSLCSSAWLTGPPPKVAPPVPCLRVGPAMNQDSGTILQTHRAALSLNENWKKANLSKPGPLAVIDMFCGCGGMSAGFKSINGMEPVYRIAGAIDIDEVANKTYEANLRVRPQRLDVSELAGKPALLRSTMAQFLGGVSDQFVLIGCAPCQGFSSHRNEAGQADPRNSLFLDFARIAARTQPFAVVVENVPELLTDRYWPIVAQARKILEKAGYFVNLSVHNMAEIGVPQERFRTLMLAMRRPFETPRGFLSRSEFRTVRHAIGNLPPIAAGERHSSDPMHYTADHRPSTIATIRAVPKNGGSRPEHVGPECLRRAKARNGRAVYEDVYGRLFWDKPAITITAYARNPASGRYVHPEQQRGLSVREAALLQSFPADYEFAGSMDERFRQVGNAVPPAFAAFIAAHVLRQLRAKNAPDKFNEGITAPVGPSFSRLIPALKAGHRKVFMTVNA
jgi:DNA (cytosine-5)-methyltransferase 1